MLAESRVILLEFNELCPDLLGDFMGRGLLPNFRRLYESSAVFTTDAGEDAPNLEPWIQWPTVHSGLPFADHGVFHLGDGKKLACKCIAEVLSEERHGGGSGCNFALDMKRLDPSMPVETMSA